MKSFRQYLLESSVVAPHSVGKGNKSGIRKTTRTRRSSYGTNIRSTIYHYPHQDGKRHISHTYTAVHRDGENPTEEELTTGVHKSKKHFHAWNKHQYKDTKKFEEPAVLDRDKPTKAHHEIVHQAKKHSIEHHHMNNTDVDTLKSTTAREYHGTDHPKVKSGEKDEYDFKPGMGRKGNIKARKWKKRPHSNWEYSNNSDVVLKHDDHTVTHLLKRKKK
tara:strand:+ start:901 stop:1554 length:654 start_codon:yes stop_codon:yes gene_type:complete